MLGNPQNEGAVYKVIIDVENDLTEMARNRVLSVFSSLETRSAAPDEDERDRTFIIVGWVEVA